MEELTNFTKKLTPAIIQDKKTGRVLMLGYMNKAALKRTIDNGLLYLWSRSRKKLWKKGESSGNVLTVEEILLDCDRDALLIRVQRDGKPVCHQGRISCFSKIE